MCGRGAETSTFFLLILSSPPPIPAHLIGEKLRWRKSSMSVLHSLLFLLYVCFTPPLCALCRPSELCVHSNPSVTTSQASIWTLSLTSRPTMKQLFDPLFIHTEVLLPPRSWSFSEQRANFGNGQPKFLESGSPDHMWPQLSALMWRFSWPSLKVVIMR